jgi:formate hydrogenlyase transcriptional activator
MPQEVERELIFQALKDAGGVIGGASGAANRLGMKRTTLYSKMKKLKISPVEFQG